MKRQRAGGDRGGRTINIGYDPKGLPLQKVLYALATAQLWYTMVTTHFLSASFGVHGFTLQLS